MAEKTTDSGSLPAEAKVITKQLLETALREYGETGAVVQTFDFEIATKKGENFSTAVFNVNVKAKIGENEDKEYFLFLKTCFDGQFFRDLLIGRGDFFTREREAFCKVIPSLVEFQQGLGLADLIKPSVPNFFYSEKNGILILENLKAKGYKMADKIKGLDLAHCKLVMKELAQLHALSFALKNGDKETLRDKCGDNVFKYMGFTSLFEDISKGHFLDSMGRAMDTLKTLIDDETLKKRLDKVLELDLWVLLGKFINNATEPYSVVCHGDSWCNNMMFKYKPVDLAEVEGDEEPIDIKLVDLQVMKYALPSTDLVYFFYSSTTREMRKNHTKELLAFYHSVFHSVLAHVKCECVDFTLEVLEEMYKEGAMFGFLFGSVASLTLFANPEVHEDHGKVPENKDSFITAKLENLTESSKERINRRLLDYMEEAIENGIL